MQQDNEDWERLEVLNRIIRVHFNKMSIAGQRVAGDEGVSRSDITNNHC